MRSPRRNLAITAVILALALAAAQAFAAGARLAPHRAIYSLTMSSTDAPGQFLKVGGSVQAILEKTCDAWISTERVKMRVTTQSGGTLRQDLMYTGWESLDGGDYRFAARSTTNGETVKYRGVAFSDPTKPGQAVYSEPKKITMSLPPGTQFYFGLTSWLIEQAQAGKSRAETIVFDGTDEEGPQKAIVFIVPLPEQGREPAGETKKTLGPLVDRPGWLMHIAFYSIDERAAEPDYEVQAVVLDNGVTPKLELVFTSFTAIQTLEKIEELEAPNC
ncbi:MAG: DUF1849 family protein [Alphaproteobacteria bacterium]|jgi:hypothetical protein|nr:DUF1849 family protein [Alphaproteobacteria bacterium]MBT7942256.1 DUF1849 family protein [Alphaproteobacteria bacterium]